MQTQQTTLNNGLRIVTCSRPNTETVSLGIWIKTGSAYEDEKINGISHFLEHMVFKGTKTALRCKSRKKSKMSADRTTPIRRASLRPFTPKC